MKNVLFTLLIISLFSCVTNSKKPSISTLDSLSKLISKDSLDIDLLKKRASIYLKNNQLDLAKKDIDDAYTIFKNDPDLLLLRGDIYYQLNQTRLSKESRERCLKLDPNDADCRLNLTELLCAVRNPNCKLMIDTLSMLNNGTVSTTLIVYLKELREYDLALKLLNNLSLINPKDKEVLTLLSIIYSDTSAFNTNFSTNLAEKYFNEALSLYANDAQLHYNFGKYQQDILKYNQALESYNHVINLDSTNKQAYYNMGFCAMQLENYTESVMYFTKAINLDQSFLLGYHARAFVHELNKDFDKAKVDWKNCLMLNPSYIPALEGLNK